MAGPLCPVVKLLSVLKSGYSWDMLARSVACPGVRRRVWYISRSILVEPILEEELPPKIVVRSDLLVVLVGRASTNLRTTNSLGAAVADCCGYDCRMRAVVPICSSK